MTLFIPARLIRLAFFTLTAGCAGFISAEATALTLCFLVILMACCRNPIRLELVFAGVAAFAARHSGGSLGTFQIVFFAVLPLIVALAGIYIMCRPILGPRVRRSWDYADRKRLWR